MELLQLSYFCHAAETENFAQTAREMGVPAAGISQSVKRLETELGATLFDRSPNGIKLNARGETFYLSAKSALSMLDDAKRKLRDEAVSGECRLLVMTCRALVENAIHTFCQKYGNVSFHISYDLTEDVDKYDLIITDNVPFRQAYNSYALLRDPIRLAVSRNHPLATRERVHVSELKNERFVTTGKESGLFAITRRICAKGHFAPILALEADDPHHVLRAIADGLGIGFVPALSWREEIPEGVMLIEIDGADTGLTLRPSMILQSAKRYASKASRLFLAELQEKAKEYF